MKLIPIFIAVLMTTGCVSNLDPDYRVQRQCQDKQYGLIIMGYRFGIDIKCKSAEQIGAEGETESEAFTTDKPIGETNA
jgi:hypothetical protein